MPGIVAILWMIFQPLLFGLIGAEVNISQIDGSTVGMKSFSGWHVTYYRYFSFFTLSSPEQNSRRAQHQRQH